MLVVPFVLCACLLPSPASAQKAPTRAAGGRTAPLSQSLAGPAREAFDAAQVLVNNDDYAGAYAKFGQAYDASKDPRLLFNMAVCARNMRDYARMQNLLTRYVSDAADSMSAEDRASVQSALGAIRTLVGKVSLSVNEPDATVSVDDELVGKAPLPAPLVLNLGKHKISASKDGFRGAEQTLDVAGGSDAALTLTLVAQSRGGHLSVVSDDRATVAVDGRPVGTGRFDGVLAGGPHALSVSEPGKVTYHAQVDLRDGETRTLDVALEDERRGAPVWPWIVGGAAVAAGAALGGYLLLQPHDTTNPVPVYGANTVFQLSSWKR
jgi:hypothetical protein